MSITSREAIEAALGQVQDINLEKDLVSAEMVKDIQIDGDNVRVSLQMGYPANGYIDTLRDAVREQLRQIPGVQGIDLDIDTDIKSHAVQRGVKPIDNIKNTIAVASGKGGVGKSTTAVNLALSLHAEGAKTGILDADIYGPSQPRMLGCRAKPDSHDGKSIEPNVSYHLQSMSIGYLVNEETPMIWRGPMVTSALEQLLGDTNWSDLDYLIIDLPPGTGDIQLTLCQKIPVSGAIIVTTPQDIALLDARKGLKMFEKVEVPVLGIVENMSTHICSQCGHEEHIFGSGGGQQMAEQYDVGLLGSLPLDTSIREGVDNGRPTVAMEPDSPIAETYRAISRRAAARLSLRAKDYSARFPKIVVENA
ncbi:MAG: iron-sulfur cluster carrier protein ApbC [Gammaproteobacteria bacterium]|nr:iron-sulfur cluster carrier protein ApbC [Gammaproteobacteria bacterium]MDE0284706.1 iron-sulfur cluster carrier protein ApbC [Gammaproteobacteria bacterium]